MSAAVDILVALVGFVAGWLLVRVLPIRWRLMAGHRSLHAQASRDFLRSLPFAVVTNLTRCVRLRGRLVIVREVYFCKWVRVRREELGALEPFESAKWRVAR